MCGFIVGILVSFGSSTLPNCNLFMVWIYQKKCFNPPLGFLFFQTNYDRFIIFNKFVPIPFGVSVLPNRLRVLKNSSLFVPIPFGVSVLPNWTGGNQKSLKRGSNPLWGFYSSKQHLCNPSIYAG